MQTRKLQNAIFRLGNIEKRMLWPALDENMDRAKQSSRLYLAARKGIFRLRMREIKCYADM